MAETSAIETLLKRDRAVVLAGLAGVTGLAWIYLFFTAAEMGAMSAPGAAPGAALGAVMQVRPWTGLDFLLMYLMWAVMMVAMMLPSAAPMILVFATINRRQRDAGNPYIATGIFTSGYLAAWGGYSAAGVSLQWIFERTGMLSPMFIGAIC